MLAHAIVLIVWLCSIQFAGCAEYEAPEQAPAPAPVVPPAIEGGGQDGAGETAEEDAESDEPADQTGAEELLERLEVAAADLESFQANISYRETDAVFDGVTITTGSVIYVIDPDSEAKRFAILFKQRIKDGALREYNEHFIFDGIWLVQKNFDNKDFIKRQIVGPGEEFDPLKLGEGPFPLPIGQKKADVVARFETALAKLPEDENDFLASKLKDDEVWGLTLIPRAGTPEAEDFEKVTVFYDRATLLPAGIDVRRSSGEREQVLLLARIRNGEVDESLIDTTVPESGWRVDIRPWRGGE